MTDKRMSDERLEQLRAQLPSLSWSSLGERMAECIAEIDALRAAARTAASGEAAECVEFLEDALPRMVFSCEEDAAAVRQAIDLLTRLSAAKEEAERERDMARAERLRAVQAANATGEFALALDTKRQAAESALSLALVERDSARADALEEAAKVCDVWQVDRLAREIRALKPVQGEQ